MSKLDLLQHTIEVTKLECHICNRVETENDAAEQAIDHFHKKGWRVKKNLVKCPVCVAGGEKEHSVVNLCGGTHVVREVGC